MLGRGLSLWVREGQRESWHQGLQYEDPALQDARQVNSCHGSFFSIDGDSCAVRTVHIYE